MDGEFSVSELVEKLPLLMEELQKLSRTGQNAIAGAALMELVRRVLSAATIDQPAVSSPCRVCLLATARPQTRSARARHLPDSLWTALFCFFQVAPDSLIGSTQICLFSTFRRTKLWFTRMDRMDAGQTIRNISKETGVWCGRSVNGL